MMTVVIGDILLSCRNITNESEKMLKPMSANYLQYTYVPGSDLCMTLGEVSKQNS